MILFAFILLCGIFLCRRFMHAQTLAYPTLFGPFLAGGTLYLSLVDRLNSVLIIFLHNNYNIYFLKNQLKFMPPNYFCRSR